MITSPFGLSNSDKDCLVALSRKSLINYFGLKNSDIEIDMSISSCFCECLGAFVSIYNNGKLRGCLGQFHPSEPLHKLIPSLTLSSSLNDSRFEPIDKQELPDLSIEISVLSPLHKINSIDEIILGRHGIFIKKGSRSGTFLPQVARKTNWTIEEFLGHCSREKAGLDWHGWKNAEVFTYEAEVFQAKLF